MKKTLLILLTSILSFQAGAQSLFDEFFGFGFPGQKRQETRSSESVKFIYDVDAQYYFDNREFARSADRYTRSMTIHAVDVTPYLGFKVQQGQNAVHRLMAGADLLHEMGTPTELKNTKLDLQLFYDATVRTRKGVFSGTAGVFPRSFVSGEYGEAFLSDSLKFYDRSMEGLLLQYGTRRFFAELGLDWMGQFGYDVKERFQIFSAGSWDATPWLAVGWAASMYHYAGSVVARGVVDNHLVNSYVRFDLSSLSGVQDLSLKAGALVSYQRDRMREDKPTFPTGGEFVLSVRNWNLGARNTLYVGSDLLPLYGGFDTAGNKYGPMLYWGSSFYRGLYNLSELYWNPHISEFVDLSISGRFHFDRDGYLGCQQMFSVIFDLERVGAASKASKGAGASVTRKRDGRGRNRQPSLSPGRVFAL